MARRMVIRTRSIGEITEVMVLVYHPMETGLRKDKETKKFIPAHFIQSMTVEHNRKVIAEANFGIAVSKNPLIGFGLQDAKNGDKVKISWKDNKGESGTMEKIVNI